MLCGLAGVELMTGLFQPPDYRHVLPTMLASRSIPTEENRFHFAVPEIHYSCFMLTPSCGGISDMKVLWAAVNPAGLCSSSCGGANIIIVPIALMEAEDREGCGVPSSVDVFRSLVISLEPYPENSASC